MINLRLMEYRKKFGLTQIQLAERLGVSFQTISKWENGVSFPDIVILSDIADLFCTSIDDLVGKTKSNKGFIRKDTKGFWSKELDYLHEIHKDMWNNDYIQFLIEKVWKFNKPIDIIEYGCGYGFLGMKLLPLFPEGSTYTGIDINEELISQAKKTFADSSFKTSFICSDLYEYKTNEKYDLAICHALLRHLNNPEIVMKKMVGSTKQGGRVISIEVNRIIEETGYFNSHIPYNPLIQLNVFKDFWKNEFNQGGRDYAIGIKLPAMMKKFGLINIESRLNDKVAVITDKKDITAFKRTKGWDKNNIDEYLMKFRETMLNQGCDLKDVEDYISWCETNMEIESLEEGEEQITFFRGLIITTGEKSSI